MSNRLLRVVRNYRVGRGPTAMILFALAVLVALLFVGPGCNSESVSPPSDTDKQPHSGSTAVPGTTIEHPSMDIELVTRQAVGGEVLELSVATPSDRFALAIAGEQAGVRVFDFRGQLDWWVQFAVLQSYTNVASPHPKTEEVHAPWTVTHTFPFVRTSLAIDGLSVTVEQKGSLYQVSRSGEARTVPNMGEWVASPTHETILMKRTEGEVDYLLGAGGEGWITRTSAVVLLPDDTGRVVGENGTISAWDNQDRERWTTTLWTGSGPDGLYASPAGDLILATDTGRGLVVAVEPGGGERWRSEGCPTHVVFSPDGSRIVACCDDGRAICMAASDGEQLYQLADVNRVLDVSSEYLVLAEIGPESEADADESIVALFGVGGDRLAEFRLPPGHPQGGFNADGDRFVLTVSRTYLNPGLDVVYIYRLTGNP